MPRVAQPLPRWSLGWYWVGASALAGVIFTSLGAYHAGVAGLAIGVVTAWLWFLAGLWLLYRADRRKYESALTIATVATAPLPRAVPEREHV